MALIIGVALALAVGIFARLPGLDRDRAFYTTVMIVIAWLLKSERARAAAGKDAGSVGRVSCSLTS